ncbi:putative gustatory receptor 28b isoform X5 [Bactrocera neohumeralis]|uniref:putative gustatory receptor 28b isoform X5 n=1 Tax=Bactrocera neohumeralis TaxID=98809 RepID=UPI0021655E9A|nr:putative gustatory receptor 28b isoform X5 [Bactrocera neohumeralis]
MHFWKDLFSPSDAIGAAQTLIWFNFMLGLTPFRLRTGDDGQQRTLHISQLGYLNTLLQVIFFMYCFIHSLAEQASIVGFFFKSEISQIGDTLQKFIGLLGMLTLFGISLSECRVIVSLCNTIGAVDRRFHNLGVAFNYQYIMKLTHLKMFLVITLNVSYMSSCFWMLFHNDIWPTFQAMITFFMPHVFLLSVVVLFSTFLFRLQQHFGLINKVLKKLAHQWDNSIVKPMPKQRSLQCLDSFSMYTIVTNNPCEIIQESMEIHHMICDAASTANKYFTYQLLTIISIAFLIIVFDAYYVLETLLGKSAHESKFKTVEFVTFFSCQMILYVIAIISIVEGSNRAIKKSEKTGGIVHSLLNKAKNAELKEKLQQFSLQLLHLKIHFTAAGLFNIDRTLYFTISGALTTYLIILLQFTNSNAPERPFAPMEENDTMPIRSLVSNLTVAG